MAVQIIAGPRFAAPISLSSLYCKAFAALAEAALNIRTRGRVESIATGSAAYCALPYPVLFRILRRLNLRSDDVFADIGCGRGRAVCCAARYPIRRVVGIELNGALLEDARRNVRGMRGRRAAVEYYEGSAADYDYSGVTALYLYNPFGHNIMRAVLDRIHASLVAQPRPLRIAYANPHCGQLFAECGWLRLVETWPAGALLERPVTFWTYCRPPVCDPRP